MSFVEDFLRSLREEPSNGARVISGQELIDILRGDAQAFVKIIGRDLPDCGNDECPIHGKNGLLSEEERDTILSDEQVEAMTAEEMDAQALKWTAAAHNQLIAKDYRRAELAQEQATLWLQVAERERNANAAKLFQQSGEERVQVD